MVNGDAVSPYDAVTFACGANYSRRDLPPGEFHSRSFATRYERPQGARLSS